MAGDENQGEEVDRELRKLIKDNQRLLKQTLGTVNRFTKLATAVAENQEDRIRHLTRLAENHAQRMDRIERALERLEILVERFVRGHRGNGRRE